MIPRAAIFLRVAIVAAILIPAFLIFVLYIAGVFPGQGIRVVRCPQASPDVAAPALALSKPECEAIGDAVNLGTEADNDVSRLSPFDLRLNTLEVGGDYLANVQLAPLPSPVIEKYPSLSAYKYFIAEDEIVLVDPQTGLIAAFVEVHSPYF